MALDLLNLSRIASAAMAVRPIAKAVNAMATTQSNLSANQSSPSPIELADTAQRRVFVVSVIFGVIAALVAAFLAWLVWSANNKYQAAIKADADARIAEAGDRAAQANESAGKANERAQNLEHDNLTLRGQVATLETQASNASKDVARLQKDAADAKAAQQRVELDLSAQRERTATVESELSKQQERAAKAEAALLKLQEEVKERTEPRTLTAEQRTKLIEILKTYSRPSAISPSVTVTWVQGNDESQQFAAQFVEVFREAGWQLWGQRGLPDASVTFSGLDVAQNGGDSQMLDFVRSALQQVGLFATGNVTGEGNKLLGTASFSNVPFPSRRWRTGGEIIFAVGLRP